MIIKSNPKALLVNLKRFTTHFQNGRFTSQKNKTVVKSKNSVTLDPFTENVAKRGYSYELREVVHHIGDSANSDRYIANGLRKEYSGNGREWVNFNDSISSRIMLKREIRGLLLDVSRFLSHPYYRILIMLDVRGVLQILLF